MSLDNPTAEERQRDVLNAIQTELDRARGDLDAETPTPWDYALPSAQALEAMRKQCDLSQAAVADTIDYSEQYIYHVEKGYATPSLDLIQRLLRLYRMEWSR